MRTAARTGGGDGRAGKRERAAAAMLLVENNCMGTRPLTVMDGR